MWYFHTHGYLNLKLESLALKAAGRRCMTIYLPYFVNIPHITNYLLTSRFAYPTARISLHAHC